MKGRHSEPKLQSFGLFPLRYKVHDRWGEFTEQDEETAPGMREGSCFKEASRWKSSLGNDEVWPSCSPSLPQSTTEVEHKRRRDQRHTLILCMQSQQTLISEVLAEAERRWGWGGGRGLDQVVTLLTRRSSPCWPQCLPPGHMRVDGDGSPSSNPVILGRIKRSSLSLHPVLLVL